MGNKIGRWKLYWIAWWNGNNWLRCSFDELKNISNFEYFIQVNGQADVALGDLHYIPYHLEIMDLSIPYTSQCLTFLTPEALSDNSWQTLVLPFRWKSFGFSSVKATCYASYVRPISLWNSWAFLMKVYYIFACLLFFVCRCVYCNLNSIKQQRNVGRCFILFILCWFRILHFWAHKHLDTEGSWWCAHQM